MLLGSKPSAASLNFLNSMVLLRTSFWIACLCSEFWAGSFDEVAEHLLYSQPSVALLNFLGFLVELFCEVLGELFCEFFAVVAFDQAIAYDELTVRLRVNFCV